MFSSTESKNSKWRKFLWKFAEVKPHLSHSCCNQLSQSSTLTAARAFIFSISANWVLLFCLFLNAFIDYFTTWRNILPFHCLSQKCPSCSVEGRTDPSTWMEIFSVGKLRNSSILKWRNILFLFLFLFFCNCLEKSCSLFSFFDFYSKSFLIGVTQYLRIQVPSHWD